MARCGWQAEVGEQGVKMQHEAWILPLGEFSVKKQMQFMSKVELTGKSYIKKIDFLFIQHRFITYYS